MKIKLFALAFALTFFSCETNLPPAVADLAMCHPMSMADFVSDKDFAAAHPSPTARKFKLMGDEITFNSADGRECRGYRTEAGGDPTRWLLLFHEWWGLNEFVKNEADQFAKELGINVLAIDLYDGQLATDAKAAGELMKANDENRSNEIIKGAFGFIGPEANIRTLGWCFGGGWSLKAALLGGQRTRGCVIYYGLPVNDIEKLKTLNSDVIFIHPTQDKWISQAVVDEFKRSMMQAEKRLQVHQYDADHAFANPSSPRSNPELADLARKQVLQYLSER